MSSRLVRTGLGCALVFGAFVLFLYSFVACAYEGEGDGNTTIDGYDARSVGVVVLFVAIAVLGLGIRLLWRRDTS